MDPNSDGVMIALLPINSDWCKIECPHMTLVYAGKIGDQKADAFNALAKDASMLASLSRPITLRTAGAEIFGDTLAKAYGEDKVDVIKLQPSPELLAMRRVVESWNASEFPFNPHVTVGPAGSLLPEMPTHIAFNKIMVGWGPEQLVFSLNY